MIIMVESMKAGRHGMILEQWPEAHIWSISYRVRLDLLWAFETFKATTSNKVDTHLQQGHTPYHS